MPPIAPAPSDVDRRLLHRGGSASGEAGAVAHGVCKRGRAMEIRLRGEDQVSGPILGHATAHHRTDGVQAQGIPIPVPVVGQESGDGQGKRGTLLGGIQPARHPQEAEASFCLDSGCAGAAEWAGDAENRPGATPGTDLPPNTPERLPMPATA